MNILLTGSVAYDYLMTFPGLFKEHVLPERLESISLSFLVDSMSRQRGGIAPNIAYTMALLGEKPRIMATVGEDFADYRAWLDSKGVDTSLMKIIPGEFTASFFATTDRLLGSDRFFLSWSHVALCNPITEGLFDKTRSRCSLAQCPGCNDEIPGRMP